MQLTPNEHVSKDVKIKSHMYKIVRSIALLLNIANFSFFGYVAAYLVEVSFPVAAALPALMMIWSGYGLWSIIRKGLYKVSSRTLLLHTVLPALIFILITFVYYFLLFSSMG